jgi:twinkle protein
VFCYTTQRIQIVGKIILKDQPCLRCKSSDAVQIYEEGPAHCFSCNSSYDYDKELEKKGGEKLKVVVEKKDFSAILSLGCPGIRHRLIPKIITEFYGVRSSFNSDGELEKLFYPFTSHGAKEVTGFKIKDVKQKSNMAASGDTKNMFGIEHFQNGGKQIVITEGEEDALSVAYAMHERWKAFYPVVSMGSASQTSYLVKNLDTLKRYDTVILWFDSDEPGQAAVREAWRALGGDRVKVVKSKEKDANEVLTSLGLEQGAKKILNYLYDAKAYEPESIIKGEALWEKLVDYQAAESIPYPPAFTKLNEKLKGIRQGEITLLVSGSGAGKSSIVREIVYHIHQTTPFKLGIIALEESPADTTRKMSGLAISKNPAKEDISLDELRVGFDKLFSDERILVLDHVGAATDSKIIDLIEFMCLQGVTHIVLDHLTILISEGIDGLDGLAAQDKVMNDLKRIVAKFNVWIGLVSHLRKTTTGKSYEEGEMPSIDSIRGSGSTKQIANDIIAFARNTVAEKESERNLIKLRVLKSRYTGLTGNAGALLYDYDTGRLNAVDEFNEDNFELIE